MDFDIDDANRRISLADSAAFTLNARAFDTNHSFGFCSMPTVSLFRAFVAAFLFNVFRVFETAHFLSTVSTFGQTVAVAAAAAAFT